MLNVEDVVQGAIILLGPHMALGRGINQLRSDADTIAARLDAALQHVAHAEIPADLLHADRLAL
jgi:hypothetical protein